MSPSIKIILATLLFTYFLNLPYDYYGLFSVIVAIGCLILAYQLYYQNRRGETGVYLVLFLIFQPIYNIELGIQTWNIVHAIVGISLLLSLFFPPSHPEKDVSNSAQIN